MSPEMPEYVHTKRTESDDAIQSGWGETEGRGQWKTTSCLFAQLLWGKSERQQRGVNNEECEARPTAWEDRTVDGRIHAMCCTLPSGQPFTTTQRAIHVPAAAVFSAAGQAGHIHD